ncbi:MAG: DNA polymerase III subunit delta [Candidatus Edwardsbacteria bacterium]|nr:DNA polymerase III subunit delta [Candidatus Edwardsbacteria bacterium]
MDTLRQQIAQKKILSGYLFFGEEERQKDLAIKSIAHAFTGSDQAGSGLEVVYGSEIDGADIVNRAQSVAMFARRTALVVKEAEGLSAKSRNAVAGYFASPSPDTCLILSTVKSDSKMALVKQFDDLVAAVNFKPLLEPEAVDWAAREARRRKLRLSAPATQLLVAMTGTDLGVIGQELDKLALLPGTTDSGEISAESVRSLAGLNILYDVYGLTGAIARRRREALSIFQRMLSSGEDPARILSSIGYELIRLWKVASAAGDAAAIARQAGLHEYAVRQLLPDAKRRTDMEYAAALDRVYRAEFRLKSGRGEPAAQLQHLIYHLTS